MSRMTCFGLTISLFASCTWAATQTDEPLGRLFFTPERRAALERQRQLNIQETQALEGSTVRLDGIVQRSNGDKTVWINGRPQHGHSGAPGVHAKVVSGDPARAALTAEGESNASLKVGETINRATREKQDDLDGGSLVVGPAKRR